jgi:ABC-type bacteriocin/lantibiotic exporter with double-glycine peptidase domain
MANSDPKKLELSPKSPSKGKALPLVGPLVLDESLRPKKPQSVEIPELALKDVLGAFLKWSASDIDVEHLVSGLPIKDGVLTEELMPRALDRFGFDAVLIRHRKVKRLTFPCCIALSTGGYVIALAQKGNAVELLDFNQEECILEVPLKAIQKKYSGRAFQLNPSIVLLSHSFATNDSSLVRSSISDYCFKSSVSNASIISSFPEIFENYQTWVGASRSVSVV